MSSNTLRKKAPKSKDKRQANDYLVEKTVRKLYQTSPLVRLDLKLRTYAKGLRTMFYDGTHSKNKEK